MPDDKPSFRILGRIFDVLELFGVDSPELGITDLANRLGLNKSVVHRIVTGLVARGYLAQNPYSKAYRLGVRCLELGAVATELNDLRSVALPRMRTLVADTNESVMLHTRDGREGVCIEKVETPQGIKCTTKVGHRSPLHAGGISKVLIAFLSEEEQDEILSGELKRFTDRTTTDPVKIKQQLSEIRQKGYAIGGGEVDVGSTGVSAPIRDFTGEVIASIGIAAPSFRVTSQRLGEFIALVTKAAEQISEELGYRRS